MLDEQQCVEDALPPRRVVVTTSTSTNAEMVQRAREIADEIGAMYSERRGRGLLSTLDRFEADRALVVGLDELALMHRNGAVYRYHPNLGFVRAMNLLNGQRDPFVDAANLKPGVRVLDCTVGFAGEALLAALIGGEDGRVVGLESVAELALVTREGLATRMFDQKRLIPSIRKIEIVNADYRDYLASVTPGDFDVIYFDPFFGKRIEGSEINIDPLFQFGDTRPLHVESVLLARELAPRVVVKHPRDTALPDALIAARTTLQTGRHRPVAYSIFTR